MVSGYINEFEEVDDHRSGKVVVQLNGRINKCGVISPRFDVPLSSIESWIALLMPSRAFGYIIMTTSAGIMDHEEARRKHVGGKILGVYSCLFHSTSPSLTCSQQVTYTKRTILMRRGLSEQSRHTQFFIFYLLPVAFTGCQTAL